MKYGTYTLRNTQDESWVITDPDGRVVGAFNAGGLTAARAIVEEDIFGLVEVRWKRNQAEVSPLTW